MATPKGEINEVRIPKPNTVQGPETIAQAFTEHRDVLAGYLAAKLLKPSDIEDVLQDTFIQAFTASKRNTITSPKGYLFIVARNLMSRKFAKQSRERTREISEVEFSTLPSDAVQADVQLHFKLKMKTLQSAVETLPPQCRRVFVMRKIHGKSQKAIAKELGIATSTVERHITIALTRLNVEMQAQGYNLTADDLKSGPVRKMS